MIRFLIPWVVAGTVTMVSADCRAYNMFIPDGEQRVIMSFENVGGGKSDAVVDVNARADVHNGRTTLRLPKSKYAENDYANGHTERRLPVITRLDTRYTDDKNIIMKWVKLTREYRNRYTGEKITMSERWDQNTTEVRPDAVPSISAYSGYTYWLEGEFDVVPAGSYGTHLTAVGVTEFNDGWWDRQFIQLRIMNKIPFVYLTMNVVPDTLNLHGTRGAYSNAGVVEISNSSNTDASVEYTASCNLAEVTCLLSLEGRPDAETTMTWENRTNAADTLRVRIKSNRAGRYVVPLSITATVI